MSKEIRALEMKDSELKKRIRQLRERDEAIERRIADLVAKVDPSLRSAASSSATTATSTSTTTQPMHGVLAHSDVRKDKPWYRRLF